MGIKFGRPERRSGGPLKSVLNIFRKFLTVLFGFLTVFLALFGLGEVIVFLLDGGKNYSNWYKAPMIIFGLSLLFLIMWTVVNYDRIGFLKGLRSATRRSKPPEDYDIPDLD